MAISKLILNGEVQMDVTSDTVASDKMLSGIVGTKNDGTKATGSIATKSAADLIANGDKVTAPAGYYSVSATKWLVTGSAFPPAVTITKNPIFSMNSSTGIVTASYTGSSSITPTVTSGYISQGTAGTISTTGTSTYQLTSQGAQTLYPSTADQTIASYRWLTGAQTIKSVTTSNLTAENIAEGIVVKVGDATNASRITQITGTHSAGGFTADDIAQRHISGIISGSTSRINTYAFCNCTRITSANFPSVTRIDTSAFAGCSNLASVSFPNVTSISSFAFQNCSSLTSVNFPALTSLFSSAFVSCVNLTSVSFPRVIMIQDNAFQNCSNLISVSFPNATSIGASAFYKCINLRAVSFSSTISIFKTYLFGHCYNLLSLYLLGSSVTSLSVINAFYSTPISNYTTSTGGVYGSIFVPASLYDSYITATNWSVYSARIVSV